MSDQFPRPCKNCGNPVHLNRRGKIVHVRGGGTRCHIFRSYEIVRDAEGLPTKMYWLGDYTIPDPAGNAQLDQDKLREWQAIYGKRVEEP